MEFEDQDDHDEEMEMERSYDSLGNHSAGGGRVKMSGSGPDSMALATAAASQPRKPGRYRECLKNHAVTLGGHALDGCGEFLAAGAEGTLDALKCAACNCHRNFHRKEGEPAGQGLGFVSDPYGQLVPHQGGLSHHQQFSTYYRTPAGYLHLTHQQQHHQSRPLALPSTSGGGGTQSRGEDQDDDMSNPSGGGGLGMGGLVGTASSGKKRFRTKFSQEQKEKMLGLAERLGWRIQKQDEAEIQSFCNETGVKRHVLKVWMHNNKHTLGKKP